MNLRVSNYRTRRFIFFGFLIVAGLVLMLIGSQINASRKVEALCVFCGNNATRTSTKFFSFSRVDRSGKRLRSDKLDIKKIWLCDECDEPMVVDTPYKLKKVDNAYSYPNPSYKLGKLVLLIILLVTGLACVGLGFLLIRDEIKRKEFLISAPER